MAPLYTRRVQSRVQSDALKILLALEPSWTVAIDGQEFLPLPAADIDVDDEFIRFGKHRRKILDIEWLRPNVVRLRTQSRFRTQHELVTFYPGSTLPPDIHARRRRRSFQKQIARGLAGYFKTHLVERGIRGGYPRFDVPHRGPRSIICVDPDESTPVVNGIMRAAILWSATLRKRISVVVPAGRSRTIVTRLRAMPALLADFEWLQWDGEAIAPLDITPSDQETHVHDYYEPSVQTEVSRICALAPGLLQAVPNISDRAISIRLRGIEVARVGEYGTTYPMGEPLQPVIEALARDRCHGSRHPLARAYEERWLESNLIRQVRDLLPVRPGVIYPQVPSFANGDRSIIDLLAITESGRLVVIEVKASADPDLPFQAFDYWLAVEHHRKAGDFAARGYFRGTEIRNEPALLVVVAPLLAFHRSMDRLVAVLPHNLPLMQVGINQSWKREIKILRRKGALG